MRKTLLLILFLMVFFPYISHANWQEGVQTQPYLYMFSSTTSVTTVKTGSGILHAITIEGGTTSPIHIYDGAINASSLMFSFTTTNTQQTQLFDVQFSSGCTVVTNGALQYTVAYR